jgi:hypothetical protein
LTYHSRIVTIADVADIHEAVADLSRRLDLRDGPRPTERRSRLDELRSSQQGLGPWVDGNGNTWHFALHWREIEGRLECVGLELMSESGTPLTAGLLRTFPLGKATAENRRVGSELHRWLAEHVEVDRDELTSQARAWAESGSGRGPKGYGAEHFAEVAAVYREAIRDSDRPTQAVAERFVVSHSAAAKWVARCRVMGLLPPTERGRAR